MKHKRIGLTTKYTLTVCAVLLAINVVLGFLFMNQSGNAMKNLIRRHMISVAETASAMLDGDELAELTADDVGSDAYLRIVSTLTKVKNAQNDSDIKYIYLVKREEDHYVYTVDPDPVNPADFGERVVDTSAQDIAWAGTAAIDPEPVEDEWGCYYTSWCPVRDSSSRVIGMVGVDFAADWYDQQMSRHSVTVVIAVGLTLLVSLAIMFLLTLQIRRRFRLLDQELSTLSGNVEDLAQVVRIRSDAPEIDREDPAGASDSDVIRRLSEKIRGTQYLLTEYMHYVQEQAYTDTMTNVGNKDAYLKRIQELNREIDAGTASFAIAVFDVNGLKSTNDNYGHECGDRIIIDASMLIRRIFGDEHIYRIGGDEFIAVIGETDEQALNEAFARLDAAVERFNQSEKRYAMPLSFSHGGSVYQPGQDSSFKEVFKRADLAMYKNKGDYYRHFGNRAANFGERYFLSHPEEPAEL